MKKKLVLLGVLLIGVLVVFAILDDRIKISVLSVLFVFVLYYINKNRKSWFDTDVSKIKKIKNKLKLEAAFYLNIIFSIAYIVGLSAILTR